MTNQETKLERATITLYNEKHDRKTKIRPQYDPSTHQWIISKTAARKAMRNLCPDKCCIFQVPLGSHPKVEILGENKKQYFITL